MEIETLARYCIIAVKFVTNIYEGNTPSVNQTIYTVSENECDSYNFCYVINWSSFNNQITG
jgi:hypothetical protein